MFNWGAFVILRLSAKLNVIKNSEIPTDFPIIFIVWANCYTRVSLLPKGIGMGGGDKAIIPCPNILQLATSAFRKTLPGLHLTSPTPAPVRFPGGTPPSPPQLSLAVTLPLALVPPTPWDVGKWWRFSSADHYSKPGSISRRPMNFFK